MCSPVAIAACELHDGQLLKHGLMEGWMDEEASNAASLLGSFLFVCDL